MIVLLNKTMIYNIKVALFLSSGIGSLLAGTVFRKLLFTGVISTKTSLRYQRLYRWLDFTYSFTLGPLSAATSVLLRYFVLLCCSLSSLARLDQPLILPELTELGLDVWEPGFAAWGGMIKAHYHADVGRKQRPPAAAAAGQTDLGGWSDAADGADILIRAGLGLAR